MCGIALCGEADLVGLARTRVIFYLTPRWTDRRSLKILIARVEFFFVATGWKAQSLQRVLIRGIAPLLFSATPDSFWIAMI